MVKTIINRILRPRHFWRAVSFSELGELYTCMVLRSMALNVIGLFVPVFLYKSGHSIASIALFYAAFFGARIVADIVAAYIVAREGPKHTIFIGNMLQVVGLSLFLTLESKHWPLGLVAAVWGASSSLFYIGYHVEFSKIKHAEHGGKELGFMFIMEKVGAILGPITGGIIATLFGPEYTIMLGLALFVIALLPLFTTSEPVRIHQKLHFKNINPKVLMRDVPPSLAFTVENSISVIAWPLFIAAFVFQENTYVKIGALSSLGVLTAIGAAKAFGNLIDDRKGRLLLRYSAAINALIHIVRPFVRSFVGVLGVNLSNEAVTAGYRMPYVKGWYDAADDQPGHRIVYISLIEACADVAKTAFWVGLFVAVEMFGAETALKCSFFVAAAASLIIMTERFPALNAKKR